MIIPLLIRAFIFVAVLYLVYKLAYLLFAPKPRYKCATCRHCGKMDRDGVMCRFGDRQVFKTPVHVENCMDYEDDPRIPGSR